MREEDEGELRRRRRTGTHAELHMHAPREVNVEINKLHHCRITALQFFHFEKHLNKPLECTYT